MKHPLFETIDSPTNWPAAIGLLGNDQIRHRNNWTRLPDIAPSDLAAYHQIDMQHESGSTSTILNPLDPGTVDDLPGEWGPGWLITPGGTDIPAARAGRR